MRHIRTFMLDRNPPKNQAVLDFWSFKVKTRETYKTQETLATRPNHIDHHWEEFLSSAIKPSIIEKNFRTIHDSREVDRVLNRNSKRKWKHSDDLVPCWEVTGLDPLSWERIEDGVQVKPDNPPSGEDGKVQKYIGATGYDTAPLFLETDDPEYWAKVLKDVAIPLFITEGAKKAAAALSILLACLSIPGVSTCRKLGRLHRHLEVFCKFGRTVYLCFDNDVMTKYQVQQALLKMSIDISNKGAKVMVVVLPEGGAKGMDDFIFQHGEKEFNKLVENALTIDEWRKKLEKDWERDKIQEKLEKNPERDDLLAVDKKKMLIHNARKEAIRNVYGNGLRWNELSLSVQINGQPVIIDTLVDKIATDCGIKFSEKDTKLIVYSLARENTYHPVRDYLNAVVSTNSDTQIIEKLSTNLFKTTEPLYDVMVKKWLIGAVARVMEPGCKMDDVLILHGKQSALKSTFFAALGGEWFSDSCEGTGNDKDSIMQLHNAWINELAEVDRFLSKRDASDLKKSLSVKVDKFRVPYGKGVEDFPRQFVTCGSTNKDEFLTDPTGNRRYWCVSLGTEKIDIDWVREHRDEIWAAAVHLYHQGHKWYLDDDEKIRHAELMKPFEVSDSWEDYIEPYVALRSEVTVSDIMLNCLNIEIGQQKKAEQMRVADILKRMGWKRIEKRNAQSKKCWVKPDVEDKAVKEAPAG